MHKSSLRPSFSLAVFACMLFLTSCNSAPRPTASPLPNATDSGVPTPAITPSPTAVPARALTVCMGREPTSLFLYGDSSVAARSLREAIYDGPADVRGYDVVPVILETKPSLAARDAVLEPVQVNPGDVIADNSGKLVNLAEGVTFFPSGCSDASCAQAFTGAGSATLDQLVVRFKLRPGLLWSDGAPLTADDSVFSFEVANRLYPRARADLIARTQSYRAVDETTVEWRGAPGARDPRYATNFFTPLPRHTLGSLKTEELLTADASARTPVSWGPYKIDEWTPGDHISLSKNLSYFRAAEGLPHFDRLVFRFVAGGEEALAALLAGECDYVDESAGLETQSARLAQLQQEGKLATAIETGTAWEHADFGITPLNPESPSLFQKKETRQGVAMCIDRQRMADELFPGQSAVPDTYVPPGHPLANPEAKAYPFDPQAGAALLQAAGWVDSDSNPVTPRVSLGVPGVVDGTPFTFTYLTADDAERQQVAQILKESLAQCGIQVEISAGNYEQLFAPGPDGPVFGRNFAMAQFGWVTSLEPPCFLYTTQEIPGPYPKYPKGWGGANASGFSSPEFNQACQTASTSLPDTPAYQSAHFQAQAIFAEELPSIPLYLRLKVVAMRPDMCNVEVDPSADSALWNLEAFDYGESCGK